jgi:hypothetical protein
MAQSRHPDRVGECLLSGVKRTSQRLVEMSAFDPKRTSVGIRASLNSARKPRVRQ